MQITLTQEIQLLRERVIALCDSQPMYSPIQNLAAYLDEVLQPCLAVVEATSAVNAQMIVQALLEEVRLGLFLIEQKDETVNDQQEFTGEEWDLLMQDISDLRGKFYEELDQDEQNHVAFLGLRIGIGFGRHKPLIQIQRVEGNLKDCRILYDFINKVLQICNEA